MEKGGGGEGGGDIPCLSLVPQLEVNSIVSGNGMEVPKISANQLPCLSPDLVSTATPPSKYVWNVATGLPQLQPAYAAASTDLSKIFVSAYDFSTFTDYLLFGSPNGGDRWSQIFT